MVVADLHRDAVGVFAGEAIDEGCERIDLDWSEVQWEVVGYLEPLLDPGLRPGPLGRLLKSEDQQLLEDCLDELPADHRELISLRHFAEMSWQEIAAEVGSASAAAARVKYAKVMKRLGERLERRREA